MVEIIENYVDEKFEKSFLSLIPNKAKFGIERNQVIRYGNPFPYSKGLVSKNIPALFDRFREDIEFDSVTINEYMPSQRIDWHIDNLVAGPIIYVVSLLSDANLDFRYGGATESYLLPRYSLVKFGGDKRYKWEHSVTVKEKRYSIVFRNSKK